MDRPLQPLRPRGAKTGHYRPRMETRAEKNLVGVDVADPPHKLLVEQQRFESAAPAVQHPGELPGCERESVLPHSRRWCIEQPQAAELPHVVEAECPVVQGQDGTRVRSRSASIR